MYTEECIFFSLYYIPFLSIITGSIDWNEKYKILQSEDHASLCTISMLHMFTLGIQKKKKKEISMFTSRGYSMMHQLKQPGETYFST